MKMQQFCLYSNMTLWDLICNMVISFINSKTHLCLNLLEISFVCMGSQKKARFNVFLVEINPCEYLPCSACVTTWRDAKEDLHMAAGEKWMYSISMVVLFIQELRWSLATPFIRSYTTCFSIPTRA